MTKRLCKALFLKYPVLSPSLFLHPNSQKRLAAWVPVYRNPPGKIPASLKEPTRLSVCFSPLYRHFSQRKTALKKAEQVCG